MQTSTPVAERPATTLRRARLADADKLAELANIAADGLPLYLWQQIAGADGDPWAVGTARAARPDGSFSYRNGWIAQADGQSAGCLVGYPLADRLQPIPADMPAMFRPVQELENRVPGSWYVNFLAVYPAYRRRGVAGQLIAAAVGQARAAHARDLTLITADANADGLAFYRASGFHEIGRQVMVKEDWEGQGTDWVLLSKPV